MFALEHDISSIFVSRLGSSIKRAKVERFRPLLCISITKMAALLLVACVFRHHCFVTFFVATARDHYSLL